MADMTGGYSEPQKATKEIQMMCDAVKPVVEEKTKNMYEEFIAVQYRSQVVNGTNYVIKVHVGGSSYLKIKVFQALPCHGGETVLGRVEEGYTKEDPLVPF